MSDQILKMEELLRRSSAISCSGRAAFLDERDMRMEMERADTSRAMPGVVHATLAKPIESNLHLPTVYKRVKGRKLVE